MNIEYKFSENPGRLYLIGPLAGLPLVIILSVLRAFLEVYLGFVSFLIFIFFMVALRYSQTLIIRASNCRSQVVSTRYGLLAGLASVYSNWAAYFFFQHWSESQTLSAFELFSDPIGVLNRMTVFADHTTYTIVYKLSANNPFFSWSIWILDFIFVLFLASVNLLYRSVFCENCHRWAEDTNLDLRLAGPHDQENRYELDADLNKLLNLPAPAADDPKRLRINIHRCDQCLTTTTLNIELMTLSKNSKGKVSESSNDYSPVYVLTNAQYEQFLQKKAKSSGR